jgi:AcrR family transcriptional regulator
MTTAAAVDESRRRAILDAALDAFLVNSVAGTTIEDIRRGSGASVGCVYHHFGSKERLAAELYLEILREYHHEFLSALRASKTAQDGVRGAVHRHFRWVAAHPERASYLFHCREPEVTAAFDASARELNEAFYSEAARWLADQVEKGEIRTLRPAVYHALWMGPSLEYARGWLAGGRRRATELSAGDAIISDAAWQTLRSEPRG